MIKKQTVSFCLLCLLLLVISKGIFAEEKRPQVESCEQQFNKLLLTTVECVYQVKPDSLKQIMTYTQGTIKDAACSVPLKFAKSQVYGEWIKDGVVRLPKLTVQCHLTGAADQKLPVTTYIQPLCKKAKDWNCTINMSGTQGLGMLGGILETQINENAVLKNEMKKFLNGL